MAIEKTTAAAADSQGADANHRKENVSVTNSGDKADTSTTSSAVDAARGPADIAPATQVDPSGAPVQIVPDVDLTHPAVDANPRAGTTIAQNKIDFNDPSLSSAEAVAHMLNAQGVETKIEDDK